MSRSECPDVTELRKSSSELSPAVPNSGPVGMGLAAAAASDIWWWPNRLPSESFLLCFRAFFEWWRFLSFIVISVGRPVIMLGGARSG